MSILVTGANGFIGSALVKALSEAGHTVTAAARSAGNNSGLVQSPSLGPAANWRHLLRGQSAVVHTAARVHVMHERGSDSSHLYQAENTLGTLALADQAAESGVRRFMFISTIKVMGEASTHPLCPSETPSPADAYARSKLAAEEGLMRICRDKRMEFVVIRPPLVYGPGAKGNFQTMMRWLQRDLPIPLGGFTSNRRSFLALDNLADLAVTCVTHPAAANQVFHAADGEDLLTAELLRQLGSAMGLNPWLPSIPPKIIGRLAALAGRKDLMTRLSGSLQVNISHACKALDWQPPINVREGLRRSVEAFDR